MYYDEDDDELKAQFHGRGDYAPGNPDLAVGSTAKLPESAPNPAFHDAEEMIRELVAALEAMQKAALTVHNAIANNHGVNMESVLDMGEALEITRTAIAKAKG